MPQCHQQESWQFRKDGDPEQLTILIAITFAFEVYRQLNLGESRNNLIGRSAA